MDKLTELLVAEGALHAVRLKQKTKTKRKKKIAAAIYEYQADCDGEWGEISVDFENGTAETVSYTHLDVYKRQPVHILPYPTLPFCVVWSGTVKTPIVP